MSVLPDPHISPSMANPATPSGAPAAAWLRLEGAAAFGVATLAYATIGQGWLFFALAMLLPDIAIAGYLFGPRLGAHVYNAAHSYAAPAALGAVGWWVGAPVAVSAALVWVAHIGIDRALGYGLKSPAGFRSTHLGAI